MEIFYFKERINQKKFTDSVRYLATFPKQIVVFFINRTGKDQKINLKRDYKKTDMLYIYIL